MKQSILLSLFFIISSFCFDKTSKPFKVVYLNKITVTGFHEDELPEYIINLNCKIDNKTFYIDTSNEFEFQKRIWPSIKQIDKSKYQLFLELNNRPNKNKIILLTVQGDKLISKQIIPTFDSTYGRQDGLKEYHGKLEFPEAMDNHNQTQYIPTLFYIDKSDGFTLDTAKTVSYNKSKWGNFYGFKPNFKLILTPNKNY